MSSLVSFPLPFHCFGSTIFHTMHDPCSSLFFIHTQQLTFCPFLYFPCFYHSFLNPPFQPTRPKTEVQSPKAQFFKVSFSLGCFHDVAVSVIQMR